MNAGDLTYLLIVLLGVYTFWFVWGLFDEDDDQ